MHSTGVAREVVVVGGGVGGLVAAIDLALAGFRVSLFEQDRAIGGKISVTTVLGESVDTGPTVLTMRAVFDALFSAAGRSLEDYIELSNVDVLARHAWPDGTRLDLFADRARSEAAVAAAFGRSEAEAFARFMDRARAIYETVEGPFLKAQKPDWSHGARELRALGPGAFLRIDALRTMARSADHAFRTPHLRQLFGRYATYCGSSPYEAPATLHLIAHVEAMGVYRVTGGMGALGRALGRLASEVGVEIHARSPVERIEVRGGRVSGISVAGVGRRAADAVVFNGDVAALAGGWLGPNVASVVRAVAPSERSFSAVTCAVVAEARGFSLAHHNVFFAADARAEFRALAEGRFPLAPTVYLCAQRRGAARDPAGPEPMLLVMNAPPTGDEPALWNDEVIRTCETAARRTLERCGLTLECATFVTTTPADFASRFPATGGAIYGGRTTGSFSALLRSGAKSRLPGLYLAGGSVHPGPGVPMAAISGRLAASRLIDDFASTPQSRPAATSGTMSTSSAPTAPSRSS